MSALNRPHCRSMDACKAKGEGHCRGCIGAATLARIKDDPARIEARRRPTSEATKAKLRAGINQRYADPAFREAVADQARRQLDLIRRNAEVEDRRRAAISRALSIPAVKGRRTKALGRVLTAKTAERVGIPAELVPLFRELRFKTKAPEAEIRAAVLSSPEARRLAEHKAAIARLRAAGPAPAIGTPARAAWSRKVNALPSLREAHPC